MRCCICVAILAYAGATDYCACIAALPHRLSIATGLQPWDAKAANAAACSPMHGLALSLRMLATLRTVPGNNVSTIINSEGTIHDRKRCRIARLSENKPAGVTG